MSQFSNQQLSDMRKDSMLSMLARNPNCDIYVVVGSSGYLAKLERAEAVSLLQCVGQSLKMSHEGDSFEISGLAD